MVIDWRTRDFGDLLDSAMQPEASHAPTYVPLPELRETHIDQVCQFAQVIDVQLAGASQRKPYRMQNPRVGRRCSIACRCGVRSPIPGASEAVSVKFISDAGQLFRTP